MSALLGKHDVVAGQVLLTPYDFVHRIAVPPRARDAAARCSTSACCRSSTRTTPSPTTRSATATTTASPRSSSHMLGADVLLMLTDTARRVHRRSAARRRRVADRGDRRGRRRARTGRGRRRHRAGQRRHGEQARGREDRGVVGRARGDRVGARCPTSSPTRSPAAPVGTSFAPRAQRLPSRKLWIAFAQGSEGRIVVDAGARRALVERRQVAARRGRARGRRRVRRRRARRDRRRRRRGVRQGPVPLQRRSSCATSRASRTADLPEGSPHEVVHRDDLVVLP